MNLNKNVKKINKLKDAVRKEVIKRHVAVLNHGCEANDLFAKFEAVVKKIRTALQVRCANRAIKLSKKHLEAKAALESIQ